MEKSEIRNPKSEIKEMVGAYIIDAEGKLIPDLNDEAMAMRQKSETSGEQGRTIPSPIKSGMKSEIKEMEVNKDA